MSKPSREADLYEEVIDHLTKMWSVQNLRQEPGDKGKGGHGLEVRSLGIRDSEVPSALWSEILKVVSLETLGRFCVLSTGVYSYQSLELWEERMSKSMRTWDRPRKV